jgi:hypothetical protein
MSFDGQTPIPVAKMGGRVTSFPRRNLASGVSPNQRNCRYGLDSVATRFGINCSAPVGFTLPDAGQVTGLTNLIEPGSPTLYIPLAFSSKGHLYKESPVGSSNLVPINSALVNLPANAYLQSTQVANSRFMAISDLLQGIGDNCVLDSQGFLDPLGQMPVGAPWQAGYTYRFGQCVTPTLGNNHLYRWIGGTGKSGNTEPSWPTAEGATVDDGAGEWQENTPQAVNTLTASRYQMGASSRYAGGGTFPAGVDVWVFITFNNTVGVSTGESNPSTPQLALQNTNLNDAVSFAASPVYNQGIGTDWQFNPAIVPTPLQPQSWNLYAAAVPTGSPMPDISLFAQQTSDQTFGTPLTLTTLIAGVALPPYPTAYFTIPGDVAIGQRYGAILFVNRNGNISGFNLNGIFTVENLRAQSPSNEEFIGDGPLYVRNIPLGPANTAMRIIALTTAGQVYAGPYDYIGQNDTLPDGTPITSFVLGDNFTTSAMLNFTDPYLEDSTDVTGFTTKILVPAQMDWYFSEVTNSLLGCGEAGQSSLSRSSNPFDYETFDGAVGYFYTSQEDGGRTVTHRDWKNQLYVFKDNGGHSVQSIGANTANQWTVVKRWDKIGPCGPRAIDVSPGGTGGQGAFICFACQSGVYIWFGSGDPTWVSMEIQEPAAGGDNREYWGGINWKMQQLISVTIDDLTKRVFICVPYGQSTINSGCFTLNYARGLGDPVHFSSFSGKEIAPPERKWSYDDYSACQVVRMQRPIVSLNPASPLDPRIAQSQLMFASSANDGAVSSELPDVYDDNGVAINNYYEIGQHRAIAGMQTFAGCSLNMTGAGKIAVRGVPFSGEPFPPKGQIIDLNTDPRGWYRRFFRQMGRQFGLRIDNNNTAGAWFEMNEATLFMHPAFPAETKGQPGQANNAA